MASLSGFSPTSFLDDDPGEGLSCFTLPYIPCYTEADVTTKAKQPMIKMNSLIVGEYLHVELSGCVGTEYTRNPTIIK